MEKIEQKLNTDAEPSEDPKFKEKWENSVFNDTDWLEKITDTIDLVEKDNEYPKDKLAEILGKLPEISGKVTQNLKLLERAIRQEYYPDIRESAFKVLLDLATVARIEDHDLLDSLIRLARRSTDPAIKVMEDGLPAKKYARIILFGAVKEDKFRERALPVLKNYILDSLQEKDVDPTDINILDFLSSADREAIRRYDQLINAYLSENPSDYEIIVACIKAKTKEIRDAGLNSIVNSLLEYGLKEELPEMITRWLNGGGTEKFMPEAFAKNIETIRSLEKERPDIVKFLISKFSIYNFGRYPESLLIKQYDEYENQNMPYGIVLFAEDDHNAFLFENKDELEEMAKELKGKYVIRFMEANGKIELLRLLTRLRLKYGQNHKISFAVVGSHGNKELLTLGNIDNHEDREILIEDIIAYGGRKYKLFDENSTVILLSCRSGQGGGIGSKISKVMDTTVIAPNFDSGLSSITPIINGDHLKFKVRYTHEARAMRFTPKKSRTRKSNSI